MDSYTCCQSAVKTEIDIKSMSDLLKLVAEPNRLQLLCILQQGTHCVCELIKHTRLSQSLISHHLKDMKAAGIVYDEKKGQWVHYSLTDKGKRMCNSLINLLKE